MEEKEKQNECKVEFIEKEKNCDLVLPWRDSLKQILAACIAHSLVIQVGINMSFSAVLLPQLRKSDSKIHTDISQESWIASIVTAALPLGSLTIGPLMDRFGRKKMCMLTTLPYLISWTLQNFATNVWYFYIARIIAGFGSGLSTVALVYVSEISHPKYRPMLLTFNSVFVTLGILITCTCGFGLDWRVMVKIFFLITGLSLVALFFIPESPYWLVVFQNDRKASAKALKWIYTDKAVFQQQFERITTSTQTTEETNEESTFLRIKKNFKFYKKPIVWKPLAILFTIFIFQQLSAAYVIVFYAVDIFKKIGGKFNNNKDIDEYVALILLGIIRFVMSIVLAVISKKVGRRILMFVSAIGMIATSFSVGMYIHLTSTDNLATSSEIDGGGTVAVILVLTYICFSSFGWLVIPWTLIGELLPVKARGVLGGLMVSMAYVIMFIMVKVEPFLIESVRLESIFFGLSVVNVLGLVFLYFFLPETLGRTFEDIAQYFRSNKK